MQQDGFILQVIKPGSGRAGCGIEIDQIECQAQLDVIFMRKGESGNFSPSFELFVFRFVFSGRNAFIQNIILPPNLSPSRCARGR